MIAAVDGDRQFAVIQQRVRAAGAAGPLSHEDDIAEMLDGLFGGHEIGNVSLLHAFSSDKIDRVLLTRPLQPNQRFELTRLGTPHAVQQLLSWLRQDPDIVIGRDYSYPPARYRDAIWPQLAEAAAGEPDESSRYHLFSAVDMLWLEQPAWPWQLVGFFFAYIADRDQAVADKYRETLLQKATGQPLSAAWSSLSEQEQSAYVAGLTQHALDGQPTERVIALRFLAYMPT